jgi:hypothetical protein
VLIVHKQSPGGKDRRGRRRRSGQDRMERELRRGRKREERLGEGGQNTIGWRVDIISQCRSCHMYLGSK